MTDPRSTPPAETPTASQSLSSGAPPDQGCNLPPDGWYCSRKPGHEGPCAARQKVLSDEDHQYNREYLALTEEMNAAAASPSSLGSPKFSDVAREMSEKAIDEHAANSGSPPAIQDGDLDSERNWPEDFAHENGQYLNTCIHCEKSFVGHKRRVTCKLCSSGSPPELKKLLRDFANAAAELQQWVRADVAPYRRRAKADLDIARSAIEALFASLQAECVMELLHEKTGKMLPVRVRTVLEAVQKELLEARTELSSLKEQILTPEAGTMEKMLIEHERLCMEDLRSAFGAEDASRAIEPVTTRILASRKAILKMLARSLSTDTPPAPEK